MLKFISAQAIQILEGAIVTHNGALTAFHELKGVDILVQRLEVEVGRVNGSESESGDVPRATGGDAAASTIGAVPVPAPPRRDLRAARRVLLFSAVNCLTVVFHQHESGGSNPAAPSGGSQLRKPTLRDVLLEIMDNVDSYGGVLAALVATFLCDVMNSDPQVVHHVHGSGLAKSFLTLIMGKESEWKSWNASAWKEPTFEPSGELIMALPNVLTALSLTEVGAKAVMDANPFPALLSVFCSDRYVMPNSRCLLNEMSAIVGTGLDELMRHNPGLPPACLKAAIRVANRVATLGKHLLSDEDDILLGERSTEDLERARTHLMQFGYNITQLLEQILHNEDHVAPFVAADGFDALLELARWAAAPGGRAMVAHATCLSGSAASATHSTTSGTLSVLAKQIVR